MCIPSLLVVQVSYLLGLTTSDPPLDLSLKKIPTTKATGPCMLLLCGSHRCHASSQHPSRFYFLFLFVSYSRTPKAGESPSVSPTHSFLTSNRSLHPVDITPNCLFFFVFPLLAPQSGSASHLCTSNLTAAYPASSTGLLQAFPMNSLELLRYLSLCSTQHPATAS